MSTSGTITFSMTAQQIVDGALRKLGVIGENATANAQQYAVAQTDLNLMLRLWQMDGPRLWGRADGALTLVSGTQEYTFDPRPMRVHTVRFAIDGEERYRLNPWGVEDWDNFPPKTRTGTPTICVLNRQRTATTVKLWPVPSFTSGAWTCPYSYDRVFEDITSSAQEVDVPQEWLELVMVALAARQTENYAASDSKDAARHSSVIQRATLLYQQAMGWDREGDVQFVPAYGDN